MANKGQQVKIKYTGTFDDGTVFDATDMHDGEPLEFTAGVGQVIPGFDAAVLDMEVGEKRDVLIEAVDGYGEYNPELLQSEKIENIPDGAELAKRVFPQVLAGFFIHERGNIRFVHQPGIFFYLLLQLSGFPTGVAEEESYFSFY